MAGTKHTADCKRVFARYDADCPRCRELMNGAPAREGWTGQRSPEAERLRQRIDALPHNCKASGCGPVCTWGDW